MQLERPKRIRSVVVSVSMRDDTRSHMWEHGVGQHSPPLLAHRHAGHPFLVSPYPRLLCNTRACHPSPRAVPFPSPGEAERKRWAGINGVSVGGQTGAKRRTDSDSVEKEPARRCVCAREAVLGRVRHCTRLAWRDVPLCPCQCGAAVWHPEEQHRRCWGGGGYREGRRGGVAGCE